ncbi:hypothetical protein D3C80_1506160 [compost metagenome]
MIGDNWRKKVVEKDTLFSVNPLLLNQYLHDHNVLYNTALSLKKLQAYITSDYFYSFACGDGSTTGPKESAKVLSWITSSICDQWAFEYKEKWRFINI